MIRDLDDTIKSLIETYAPDNSELANANITFDLPDSKWRDALQALTVNCYLYDIRQNHAMQTNERLIVQGQAGNPSKPVRARVRPPERIDCAYCITAWSPAQSGAVFEEHRLLGQMLRIFLEHPTIPPGVLQGGLVGQFPPYPGIIAAQDGVRNLPEFWSALEQKLKPSLNYVITLAVMIDEIPTDGQMNPLPTEIKVAAEHR